MFKDLSEAVAKQIDAMKDDPWFEVALPKDELWDLYLASFPEGVNPFYKARTEHDCNCCKNFIRDIGGLVAICGTEIKTVWDVQIGDGNFQVVADALAKRLRQATIANAYSHVSLNVGVKKSLQQHPDGSVQSWDHFYGKVPKEVVNVSATKQSEINANVAVFKRGLEEITDNSVDVILELIDQNSIYRGEEFKKVLQDFKSLKLGYANYTSNKEYFLWANWNAHGSRIRNTAIGTLLQDLSADVELDHAVKSFEAKVAPTNYKRPAPLITKKMIDQALAVIKDDGLESSLQRRFAVIEDISINDILFADRSVKPSMRNTLLDSLTAEVKEKPKDFSNTKDIHINDFIENVLPNISSMEVCFENSHQPNLISLISPLHVNATNLFKWNNPFSWSYNGNVTDSIKERVKAAGGKVDGYMRVSLSWFNHDDLDLHIREPGSNGYGGYHISFSSKISPSTGGTLDVDMNAGCGKSRTPVENICWDDRARMPIGNYQVSVHNFCKRESIDVGFEVEIECANDIYKFNHTDPVLDKKLIEVATITFDGQSITNIVNGKNVSVGSVSKNIWGLDTNKFYKVSLMTLSPNHWHGSEDGNKHFIFVLDGCKNPERARGFYNEFLPAKYNTYRKVFEVLGDKTKCEHADVQLSGLGFSSTKENAIVCKVSGNVNRMLRIIF